VLLLVELLQALRFQLGSTLFGGFPLTCCDVEG